MQDDPAGAILVGINEANTNSPIMEYMLSENFFSQLVIPVRMLFSRKMYESQHAAAVIQVHLVYEYFREVPGPGKKKYMYRFAGAEVR